MYVDALKQYERRGENKRFVTHHRRNKNADDAY
jgi:hypothetical protein